MFVNIDDHIAAANSLKQGWSLWGHWWTRREL